MNELTLLRTLRDDVSEPTTDQLQPAFARLEARMRGERVNDRRGRRPVLAGSSRPAAPWRCRRPRWGRSWSGWVHCRYS